MKTVVSISGYRFVACAAALSLALVGTANAQWSQWGGPNRDFNAKAGRLADTWPESGPPKVWHRELGDGCSSIIVDDGVLYTMYRKNDAPSHEYTIALNAETGKTIWEYGSPAPAPTSPEFSAGPNSTPLIVGKRIFTVGTSCVMHCLNKETGTVLWKQDILSKYNAPYPDRYGYSPSPIAYKNSVIVAVGRPKSDAAEGDEQAADDSAAKKGDEGQALIAFDQESGKLLWKSQDYSIGYSSPILINVGGQDQLALVVRDGIIGVDPNNGKLLWRDSGTQAGMHKMTPIDLGNGQLFYSTSGGSSISRVIQLTRENGKTTASELWQSRKARFVQGNPVLVGDYVYGSSGSNPSLVMGINIRTGKRAWLQRGFDQASFIRAGDRIIFVDWNGKLAIASVTPKELTIHSQCQLTERYSFTAPTLIDTTLYVRDRKHIMALDLGKTGDEPGPS